MLASSGVTGTWKQAQGFQGPTNTGQARAVHRCKFSLERELNKTNNTQVAPAWLLQPSRSFLNPAPRLCGDAGPCGSHQVWGSRIKDTRNIHNPRFMGSDVSREHQPNVLGRGQLGPLTPREGIQPHDPTEGCRRSPVVLGGSSATRPPLGHHGGSQKPLPRGKMKTALGHQPGTK